MQWKVLIGLLLLYVGYLSLLFLVVQFLMGGGD
jgi:hypothetical protein